jgi:hypothetical protein
MQYDSLSGHIYTVGDQQLASDVVKTTVQVIGRITTETSNIETQSSSL